MNADAPLRARASVQIPDGAPHLLIVDDDKRIRDLLARYLQDNGYRVAIAVDASGARAAMRNLSFDLFILDVMMPGESGLELARWLRQQGETPILMLTAQTDPDQRIAGLETGVDDYLAKPFEPRELLLRIKNVLRRGRSAPRMDDEVRFGELTFHIGRGELKKDGEPVRLTERERDLLRLFAQRLATPVPRHELAKDPESGGERAIDVQVNRLRRKIEVDPANPVYLQTVRGKGYILYAE